MSAEPRGYEIVSVSLPRDLVKRANALIPKTRRSRVITKVLTSYLDAIERRKLAEDYRAYYAQRPAREAREERDLLGEWQVSDDEAWSILEGEETRDRRSTR
jgi:metal-responsive CopG/Arc/MetJ family transcriptional regulator